MPHKIYKCYFEHSKKEPVQLVFFQFPIKNNNERENKNYDITKTQFGNYIIKQLKTMDNYSKGR